MINETHFKRLVIAAYRLPFKFTKRKRGTKLFKIPVVWFLRSFLYLKILKKVNPRYLTVK